MALADDAPVGGVALRSVVQAELERCSSVPLQYSAMLVQDAHLATTMYPHDEEGPFTENRNCLPPVVIDHLDCPDPAAAETTCEPHGVVAIAG